MRKFFVASAVVLALAAFARDTIAQCLPRNYVVNGSVPIPDSPNTTGASLALVVPPDPNPACNVMSDVNVDTIIAHTWQGDLTISVTSPMGTTVTLMNRPGVPQSTFGHSNDNIGNPLTGAAFIWDDEAGQGLVVLLLGQLEAQLLVDLRDVRAGPDLRQALADAPDRGRRGVAGLRAHVADDLGHEIAHGDQTRRAAVLVEHDRHALAASLQLAQQLVAALRARDEVHGA